MFASSTSVGASSFIFSLLSFPPCLWGLFPGDGPQMATTEKSPIPDGVLVRTQTRDLTIRKPDNNERILEQPGFTILPRLTIPPQLTILRHS